MNAQEIITELLSQGHTIRLSSNGERIYVKPCANDEITPNQMDAIKNHRQQILEELRHMEFQGALLATIDQIARVWPRNWEPTLACDMAQDELDAAAKAVQGDYQRAVAALQNWERVFVEAIRKHRST